MSIAGRYHDGLVADARDVALDYEALGEVGTLVIRSPGGRDVLARWPAADLSAVPAHLVPDYDSGTRAAPPGAPPSPSVRDVGSRTSRAHQARFLPGDIVATTDLGFDLVRLWRRRGPGLRPVGDVALPPGSGPRHTVWHPSGHLYVLTELSREVFVLGADREGMWRMLSAAPISPAALDGDTGAELAVSDDGESLYAGLRGSDTIGVLRVRGAGNRLESTALVESGVRWPRHHVMVRDTLIVAGQHSDEVVSSTRDPRTGIPGRVRHRIAVPSPTCVLPVR